MGVIGVVSSFLNRIAEKFGFFVIFRDGRAIGEMVCMTAIIRQIHANHRLNIVVISPYPEIFSGIPGVFLNIGLNKVYKPFATLFIRCLDRLEGSRIFSYRVKIPDSNTFEKYMREEGNGLHLAAVHAQGIPLAISTDRLRPQIQLSEKEIAETRLKLDLPQRYAVIHSGGKTTYTPNKEWSARKFQEVVNLLPEIQFVQTGLANDHRLDGVKDECGKTENIRELAALIQGAEFVVCVEGLLNHIAAAFHVKVILIQSGFSDTTLSKYETTYPVVSQERIRCAPCWLRSPCLVLGKPCTGTIEAKQVVEEIRTRIGVN